MIFLRKDVRSFAASFITRINKKTQVLALFFLVKTISNENHTTRVQPSNNSGTKAYQNKHHVWYFCCRSAVSLSWYKSTYSNIM